MSIQLYIALAASLAVVVLGQQEPPTPYAFEYRNVGDDGGESFHSSSGDGSGRVTGSYGLTDVDGRDRRVEYVADENGFRATVTSNEPGVDGSVGSPADVEVRTPGGSQPIAAPQPRRVIVQPAAPRRVLVARPQPIPLAAAGGYRVISTPRAAPVEYVYVR